MATVIQPLVNGARVAFTITFTIPADIQSTYGNGIVKDTLPTGFSLYTGAGSETQVQVGTTTLTATTDYTVSTNGQNVTFNINNASLTAGENLVVTIDTSVTDSATVQTPSTNTADLTFASVSGILGTGSVEYSLINPGPISYTGNTLVSGMIGAIVPITLEYTTDGTTDSFNYVITNDFGANLTYTGVTASYQPATGDPVTITPTVTDPVQPSTAYTFTIANVTGMADSTVTLVINTTMNTTGSAATTITNTSNLSIGGTTASTDTATLTVVPKITVTKALA